MKALSMREHEPFQPKAERRDRQVERLLEGLKKMSDRVNREFAPELTIDLMLPDGTLNMEAWATKRNNGPFRRTKNGQNPDDRGEDTIQHDKAFVRALELERAHAEVDDTDISPGVAGEEELLERFRKKRIEGVGFKLEMALTIMLHKVIGEEFLVARTTNFDNNKHGVDHQIIDRKTGNVVCTFDEVADELDGERHAEKIKKVRDTARKGGSKVKYGLTFTGSENNRKLVRQNLKDIPLFTLSLSRPELDSLLQGMDVDPDAPCTSVELQFFDTLMLALEEQRQMLSREDMPPGVKNNLEAFKASFARMRQLGSKVR